MKIGELLQKPNGFLTVNLVAYDEEKHTFTVQEAISSHLNVAS